MTTTAELAANLRLWVVIYPQQAGLLEAADRLDDQAGLLAECREWMDHVKQLGYDFIDPTLRATLDHHLGATS